MGDDPMMWAAYIVAMALLVVARPLMYWQRRRARWDRHPQGSAGVLRDEIVSYAPMGAALLAIMLAVALSGLGMSVGEPGVWKVIGAITVAAFIGGVGGFLPPVMAARQRLLRLRSKSEA